MEQSDSLQMRWIRGERGWARRVRRPLLVVLGLGLAALSISAVDDVRDAFDSYRGACEAYESVTHDFFSSYCKGDSYGLSFLTLIAILCAISLPLAIGLLLELLDHPCILREDVVTSDDEAVYVPDGRFSIDEPEEYIRDFGRGIAKIAIERHRLLRAERDRKLKAELNRS